MLIVIFSEVDQQSQILSRRTQQQQVVSRRHTIRFCLFRELIRKWRGGLKSCDVLLPPFVAGLSWAGVDDLVQESCMFLSDDSGCLYLVYLVGRGEEIDENDCRRESKSWYAFWNSVSLISREIFLRVLSIAWYAVLSDILNQCRWRMSVGKL